MPALLSVQHLSKRFGGLAALQDVSFDVYPGTIVGLIGPNGSGKSTVFNLVTRVLPADSGTVTFDGQSIDTLAPFRIARLGVGRTYQNVRIYRDLTVWMNLEIAALGRSIRGWEARGREWLGKFGIAHLADEPADHLSVGQQRLLEIAMNLVTQPRFLMLDEPLAGVNPVVRDLIAATIIDLRNAGHTFLIIEHHMHFVMRLCDQIVVLDHGERIAGGTPDEVRNDARVIDALLGQGERREVA